MANNSQTPILPDTTRPDPIGPVPILPNLTRSISLYTCNEHFGCNLPSEVMSKPGKDGIGEERAWEGWDRRGEGLGGMG